MSAESTVHGRSDGQFPTTRWSVITSAREGDAQGRKRLCEAYYPAVLAFFQEAVFSVHDAKDLTQSFFAFILSRAFLKDVSREEGRFRTFLIRSLQHYLCDYLDRAKALKRGGGQPLVSLQDQDPEGEARIQPADPRPRPDQAFDREWVRTLMGRAFAQLERECERHGRRDLLQELEPVLHQDDGAPSYREIARRHGTTEGAVKAAAKRIRDRLQWLIRDEVKRTLQDESQCDAEIRDLMAVFGPSAPPALKAARPRRSAASDADPAG